MKYPGVKVRWLAYTATNANQQFQTIECHSQTSAMNNSIFDAGCDNTIRPSDAHSWTLCRRRAWLDQRSETTDEELDPFDKMIGDRGLLHELHILEVLAQTHKVCAASSVTHTKRLMSQGAEVIYQAELVDKKQNFVGRPDFLIKTESGEYQAADAKLTINASRKDIKIQLGFYRRLLGNSLPAIAFLGDGSHALVADDADKLVDEFINDMHTLQRCEVQPEAFYSHSKCGACPYIDHCKPGFIRSDDVSLLYGVDSRVANSLSKLGIRTIKQLAESDVDTLPDIPYLKGETKKQRAILQAQSWQQQKVFQLGKIELPKGHWIHFDIEDNPVTENGEKHVYLWGFLLPDTQKHTSNKFDYVWTDTEDQDKQGWKRFLAKVESYRNRWPDMLLIHFSHHERSTIQQYANRYQMQNNPTVKWLLENNSPLFDIQKLVTEHFVLPLQGYGLKDICKHPKLVNFQWQEEGSGSQWSVVQFQQFLEQDNQSAKQVLKEKILSYNRDDVVATHMLELWLRKRSANPLPLQ